MKRALFLLLLVLLLAWQVFAGSQQTSSTLASTIITNARYYLNSTEQVPWADAELLVHLNNGTLDIVARTRCLEGAESVSMVADTREYSLSNTYLDISTVIYNGTSYSKGLIRKKPQAVGNLDDPDEPAYWYEWNGKVGLFPTLSSVTTETATVYYVARPATVASNENVLVPAAYDKALTLYIAGQALLKTGQYAKSGRLMAEYYAELDRFRADFNERPKDPEALAK